MEGVNNANNNLHCLVINNLLITAVTLRKQVGTKVHIESVFNNPLQEFKNHMSFATMFGINVSYSFVQI
jgi:hypothetical protein